MPRGIARLAIATSLWLLSIAGASPARGQAAVGASRPNIVLILTDDQGYSDLGCTGASGFETPRLDRLASEGTRFTDFYVAQAVCTASRAALLSGSYPNRIGLEGALNHTSLVGIHPDEVLLSELCQSRGYATAIFGKWHLGTRPEFSPLRHGFDVFFGIPYSNDNGPLHPVIRDIPGLPLLEGLDTVELDPDQSQFTRRFTERAVRFIEANRDRPFFLYLPHVMPHVPIFASESFRGRTERGLYGDVIEELDASVGAVLDCLDRLALNDQTLVIFLSDNGPFLSYGTHAGSAAPLREGKLTTFEGGLRTPCLMRWPGRIPAGRLCDEPLATIDLLPTIAGLIGATLPDHPIDGRDIWPVLAGQPGAVSPHEALFFYAGNELQAVRRGRWKLHFPHEYLTVNGPPGTDGKPANYASMQPRSITESGLRGIASRHGYRVEQIGQALYDLNDDPGETRDVAADHPDVVARLTAQAELARAELGDALQDRQGAGSRPVGRVEPEATP